MYVLLEYLDLLSFTMQLQCENCSVWLKVFNIYIIMCGINIVHTTEYIIYTFVYTQR